MNITKTEVDSLNAVVTVEIQKDDYDQKVNDILNNYRKSANLELAQSRSKSDDLRYQTKQYPM